jgi:anti-sigma B factor antagonist
MRIQTQDYNDVTVIALEGELDSDATEPLKKTVTDAIAKGPAGIVLDMSGVAGIDSQGLEQLLWSRDYCNDNKCEFRLAAPDENCEKILEVTRLDSQFDRYAELAQAARSFA